MKQMAENRKPYYYGVGENVEGCNTLEEIMDKAGLNWEVEKQPIFLGDNSRIEDSFATVRKDNGRVLGIVGRGYEVVQNREGFDFIEDCLGYGITFTKAGTYDKGKRVFMIGEAPTVTVLGDEVHPSILFKNSHDGSGAITAMFTPMRIVCENGLMIPIPGHQNGVVKFTISHTKNVKDRLRIVEELITKNNIYIEALKRQAETWASTPFSAEQYYQLAQELAEVKEDENGERKLTRGQESMIEDLMMAYKEEDVKKFEGTAWQALLAVSDYDSHKINSRNTGNIEYNFDRVAYGMSVLAQASQIISRMTGVAV